MNLKILIPAAVLLLAGISYKVCCVIPPPLMERCIVLIDTTVADGINPPENSRIKSELVTDMERILQRLSDQFFKARHDREVEPLLATRLSTLFVDDRSESITPLYELPSGKGGKIIYPPGFKDEIQRQSEQLLTHLRSQDPSTKQGSHYIEALQNAAAVSDAILIVGDLAVEEGSKEKGIHMQSPNSNIETECKKLQERLAPVLASKVKIGILHEPVTGPGAVMDQNQRIRQCWRKALSIPESDLSNGVQGLVQNTRCFHRLLK